MGILDAIAGFFSDRADLPDRPEPIESRPPFIIEVARAQPSSDLRLKDLFMTHPACGDGRFLPDSGDNWLACQRCHVTIYLEKGEDSIGVIFWTAFDGEGRWVKTYQLSSAFAGLRVQCPKP